MVNYLKLRVSFTNYMLETRGLVNLGGLSGEDLALSSWWISLDGKLDVSGIMDLAKDISTDVNRTMRSNAFGMPSTFLYFY